MNAFSRPSEDSSQDVALPACIRTEEQECFHHIPKPVIAQSEILRRLYPRTHEVFRNRHSSSVISCHDSRPDLVSLGSVEHVRVDDPLCRRFLGLMSSYGHSRLLYPCGLVVCSSDFQTSVHNFTIVVITKLTSCVENHFHVGSTNILLTLRADSHYISWDQHRFLSSSRKRQGVVQRKGN